MTPDESVVPVSVVVVARDEEPRIAGCLESIRRARPQQIMVVVDDRTTDRTAETAAAVAREVIVAKGYRGRLRNIGWKHCDQEFVCFVDADQLLPPDYLERLHAAIASDSRLAMVGAPQRPCGSSPWQRLAWMVWDFRGAFGTGGSLYRKVALQAVGGFGDELHAGEDGDLSARLVSAAWTRHLCESTFSFHSFPDTLAVTKHKLRYGAAGGIRARSLWRILLSVPAAVIMALKYRSLNILWYCPWRAIYLAFWGGLPPTQYHPKRST